MNASRTLDINPKAPPFDNPEIRRAMALSLDRKAFLDILGDGHGEIGVRCCRLPPGSGD